MSKQSNKSPSKRERGAHFRIKLLVWASIATVLLIAISVTVLVLVLGGGRAVMHVNSEGISRELYSYWRSYGKYTYLARNGGDDSSAFWASDNGSGVTHDEACRKETEAYMVQMLVSSQLYDSIGGKLTESERKMLSRRAEAVLQYEISSRAEYDKVAKKHGFSYSAMCEAMIYSYKNEVLRTVMTGDEGSKLTDAQLEHYYELAYTRALILEVRTENYYKVDDEGDLIQNSDGSYKLFWMTDEEKAAAKAKIERICSSLETDGSLEHFEELYATENEDIRRALYPDGYFFSETSGFSDYFSQNLPEGADDVLTGILGQEINSWRRYNAGDRTWIIFVTGTTERPYEDQLNEDFFHDLSANAADYFYAKTLGDEIKAARVRYDKDFSDAGTVAELSYDYRLFFK